jgi:uncharacterized protein
MPTRGPQPVVFAITGPITRDDLPGLCTRVCGLLTASDATLAICDVAGVQCDAVTVDALARLQLAARRQGCRVGLRDASDELRALVAFMGLTDVFAVRSRDEFSVSRQSIPVTGGKNEEETMAGIGNGRMMYLNLAVEDLARSVEFFTELGFTFDQRFTDETATAMVVNEQAVVMLIVKDRFRDFTTKELADPGSTTEAITALSAASREDVDAFADKALASGGSPANEPMEMDFMYGRSFQDPDGHLWEIVWMDPSAVS